MTEAYYPENSTVKVYTFVEKEVCNETPDGVETAFTVDNTIANTTGLDTNPLPDYFDASGNLALRDVAVYYRKNNVDTQVDESAISSISGDTITFASAPTTTQADSIVASYSHTEVDKTFDVTEYSRSGGGRDTDSVATYGGHYIDKEMPQEQVEVSITAIANDITFSEAVNGVNVTTTTEVSGKTIQTSTGGQTRSPKTIVVDSEDPLLTTNHMMWITRNVKGTALETSAGAKDYYEESVTFKCKPTEFAEITYSA